MAKKLKMSFEPTTVEHLGLKMYSKLPMALAELIANAYDADSEVVNIYLNDTEDDKKITVVDDGIGMTFDEVNDCFLRIGRNRRKEGSSKTKKGRIVTGKKGLGKLALFGIGNIIKVTTTKEGINEKIEFTLNWQELINTSGQDYEPKYRKSDSELNEQGTIIELTELKRKSNFDLESLTDNISNLFNFFKDDFKVFIHYNNGDPIEIDQKLKYSAINKEFEWNYLELIDKIAYPYEFKTHIAGKIFSTKKPLKPGWRGITLFANGRMVNSAEFYGVSESSHGFSYITGWLEVDFIDNFDEDVIATNRQSLNWENPKVEELRNFLKNLMSLIEREWRDKRKEKRREEIREKTSVDLQGWFNTLPQEIQSNLEPIVTSIVDKSELSSEDQTENIENLHRLVPEYPLYHWRHLHPQIQEASKKDYVDEDYYRAFLEAAKRYISITRDKSLSTQSSEFSLMSEVFGNNKILSVTKKYKKPDGSNFTADTLKNIEEGQKFLSMGIVQGGRNPISHEEIINLKDSDLFSEKDCLDGLSLLSHLMRRLDNSEKNE